MISVSPWSKILPQRLGEHEGPRSSFTINHLMNNE